jgi:hypothetical protein
VRNGTWRISTLSIVNGGILESVSRLTKRNSARVNVDLKGKPLFLILPCLTFPRLCGRLHQSFHQVLRQMKRFSRPGEGFLGSESSFGEH